MRMKTSRSSADPANTAILALAVLTLSTSQLSQPVEAKRCIRHVVKIADPDAFTATDVGNDDDLKKSDHH